MIINEIEEELLNIDYIEEVLKGNPNISKGKVFYDIKKSDTPNSKSVYIYFCTKLSNNQICRETIFRVSDHKGSDRNIPTFLVFPEKYLTQSRKDFFEVTIDNAIRYAIIKALKYQFNWLSRTVNHFFDFLEDL
jgi:hypothetical protein